MRLRDHEHVMLSPKVFFSISSASSVLIKHKMTTKILFNGLGLLASVTVVEKFNRMDTPSPAS
jgi:hypothetical protein